MERIAVSLPPVRSHPAVNPAELASALRDVLQEMAVIVDAEDSALLRDRPDHLVRQVSGVGGQTPGIGVGGHKGLLGRAEHIPDSGVGQVGHIDDHAQGLHLLQDLKAPLLQALLRLREAPLSARPGQAVLIVPGEGHHPGSQAVEGAQKGRIPLADFPLLQGQQGGHPPLLQVPLDLRPGGHRRDSVPVLLHHLVKEIRHAHAGEEGVLRPLQVHKEGKILKEIIPRLHLFQINVEIVVQKRNLLPPLPGLVQLQNCVTMHIHYFHFLSILLISGFPGKF